MAGHGDQLGGWGWAHRGEVLGNMVGTSPAALSDRVRLLLGWQLAHLLQLQGPFEVDEHVVSWHLDPWTYGSHRSARESHVSSLGSGAPRSSMGNPGRSTFLDTDVLAGIIPRAPHLVRQVACRFGCLHLWGPTIHCTPGGPGLLHHRP